MDRDAEIALARSAARDAISRDAKVLVLGPHGYEIVYGKFTTIWKKQKDGPMEASPQHDKFQSRSQELIRGEPSRAAKNFDKTVPRRGSNEPTIVKTIALQSFALVVIWERHGWRRLGTPKRCIPAWPRLSNI